MKRSDVVRGALAGAIGGVVGAAIKLACEAVVPPRPPDREAPPGILAASVVRRANGRELSKSERGRAAMTAHWIFSAVSGAFYGVAIESRPSLEKTEGISLGVSMWLVLHEIFLPLVHATPPLLKLPLSEQINECITHCAFGFSVERTRRTVRPLFDPL